MSRHITVNALHNVGKYQHHMVGRYHNRAWDKHVSPTSSLFWWVHLPQSRNYHCNSSEHKQPDFELYWDRADLTITDFKWAKNSISKNHTNHFQWLENDIYKSQGTQGFEELVRTRITTTPLWVSNPMVGLTLPVKVCQGDRPRNLKNLLGRVNIQNLKHQSNIRSELLVLNLQIQYSIIFKFRLCLRTCLSKIAVRNSSYTRCTAQQLPSAKKTCEDLTTGFPWWLVTSNC